MLSWRRQSSVWLLPVKMLLGMKTRLLMDMFHPRISQCQAVSLLQEDCLRTRPLSTKQDNAVFECSVVRIYAEMTVNGHTYIIEEKAQEGPISVNCVCPYDLGYDIGPLTEGEEYTVSIRRGKSEESEVAKFIFTYSPTVKGQISRK